MIGEIGILEPGGLFDIHQLINRTIKKSTLHIHLLQLEIMMRSISNQQMNRFKASNGSKGFTVVDTLDLGVALSYQTSLVANDDPMSILLVLENLFGSNDIMVLLGPWHQSPHLVALEVVEFFMHGIKPIRILERLIDLLGFNTRDKRVMSIIVC